MNKRTTFKELVFLAVLLSLLTLSFCETIPISERLTKTINSDGTITVTDRYVNALNENGVWERVDNTLWKTENGVWLNRFGNYKAYFKENPYTQVYSFIRDGHEINYAYVTFQGLTKPTLKTGVATDNYMSYTLSDYSKIDYFAYDYKVKALVTLDKRDMPNNINSDFRIIHKINPTKNLVMIQTDTRTEFIDSSGSMVMFIENPFAYDSNGTYIDLDFEFREAGNNVFYDIIIPKDFLISAVYPVMIDPTTSVEDGYGFITGDTYTQDINPTVNYGTAELGYVDNDKFVYVGVDTSLFGYEYAELINASLYYYVGTDGSNIVYFYCDAILNELGLTWATQEAYFGANICKDSYQKATAGTGYKFLDITEIVKDDNIFTLKITAPDGAQNVWRMREYSGIASDPYITFSYTVGNFTVTALDEITGDEINSIKTTFYNGTNTFVSGGALTCLSGDLTIKVEDENGNYPARTYYYDNYDCADTVNFTAYLLSYLDGCYMDLNVQNSMGAGIPNALVSVWRDIDGTDVIVAQGMTGSTGKVPIWLGEAILYDVQATYLNQSASALVEMLSCGKQYTMYITTEVYEMVESLFDSVSYWYRPTIRNLACGTDVETLFGVYDSKDSLEWWGINVTANYQNTTYISNLDFFNSTDSSGGQDTQVFNLTNTTEKVCMNMFIKKTGYPVWTKANCVRVTCYTSSFTSLFETLSNAETNLGVDILTLSLISILIVAVIMFSISSYVGANASAWVGLLLLGVLTYVNWFDWRFYAVMLMGYIGYTLMQGGTN